MRKEETLVNKVKRLLRKARIPRFLNKFGPKWHPTWMFYLAHMVYTTFTHSWRRTAKFMEEYYGIKLHFNEWRRILAQWPVWVWNAIAKASVDKECETAAIDGTGVSRSNPSQHYLKRIDREDKVSRPTQCVVLVDVENRKFLAWRFRAKPRGEKCDVPYLIKQSPALPEMVLMDKGFDSNAIHDFLRKNGIWSVAPVRKGCKRGQYRRQLRDCFDWALYWQRNIVESLISALKRLFGSHIRARHARTQRAEIFSRFIAYNIGIILTTRY